jgi:hypothetical protein
VAAALRNDSPPVLGVLFERIVLERINLVSDDAGYSHENPPGGQSGRWSDAGALLAAPSAACRLLDMNNSSTIKV